MDKTSQIDYFMRIDCILSSFTHDMNNNSAVLPTRVFKSYNEKPLEIHVMMPISNTFFKTQNHHNLSAFFSPEER